MAKHKKDDDKIDPKDVAALPTFVPENETPYDMVTKKPADRMEKPLENGPWGGLYDDKK